MNSGYYALGDSMSIDDYAGGPGLGAASLLADDLGIELRMLAADGATSDDVLRRQVGQVVGRPALVTLTMGGNDLLSALDGTTASTVERVATNYDAVLLSLGTTGARIVVSTVYDPTDGTGDLSWAGLPDNPDGLDALDALNAAIRATAARHGAALADLHGAFLGHGMQAGDIAATEARPANRDLWFCGHIEPNAWGAEAIREAWRAALR